MRQWFAKFKKYLLQDVKNETETKELAVLLRLIVISYFIYYLFVAVILAFVSYYFISLILLLFIGFLVGAFICTYEDRTQMGLKLFFISTISCAVFLTFYTGWHMNFQWSILIAILILFFSIDTDMNKKKRNTRLLLILFISVCILTHVFPVYKEPGNLLSLLLQTLNTVFYGFAFYEIAYCYSTKFNQAEEKLRKINYELLQMASLDSLTQLSNRRSMNEHLSALVYEFDRVGTPFCIAIADVDLFKHINDDYGHDTGDYILKALSEIFKESMEQKGVVARWGGEEFLFSFEGMNAQQAFAHLEVMRIKIANTTFHYKDNDVKLSITFGLEEYSQITGIEATISKADIKLYQGKTSGRNKVVF